MFYFTLEEKQSSTVHFTNTRLQDVIVLDFKILTQANDQISKSPKNVYSTLEKRQSSVVHLIKHGFTRCCTFLLQIS